MERMLLRHLLRLIFNSRISYRIKFFFNHKKILVVSDECEKCACVCVRACMCVCVYFSYKHNKLVVYLQPRSIWNFWRTERNNIWRLQFKQRRKMILNRPRCIWKQLKALTQRLSRQKMASWSTFPRLAEKLEGCLKTDIVWEWYPPHQPPTSVALVSVEHAPSGFYFRKACLFSTIGSDGNLAFHHCSYLPALLLQNLL